MRSRSKKWLVLAVKILVLVSVMVIFAWVGLNPGERLPGTAP
jgi:hypothetical protein